MISLFECLKLINVYINKQINREMQILGEEARAAFLSKGPKILNWVLSVPLRELCDIV